MFGLKKIDSYKIYFCITIISLIFFWLQSKKLFFIGFFNKTKSIAITQEKQEIELLMAKNAKLQHKIEHLLKYEEIYNSLQKTGKIKSFLDVKFINLNSESRYLIASTSNNVNLNDAVLNKDGFLIGRIIAKNKNIVKILLIDSKSSNLPVVSSSGAIGILQGTGRDECKTKFIPLSDEIPDNNDLIVTSGIDELIQGGIIVGKMNVNGKKMCVDAHVTNNYQSLAVIEYGKHF